MGGRDMGKSLISQVNIKEDFILFKKFFIDLGKIAFVEERQGWQYFSNKYGSLQASEEISNHMLIIHFIGMGHVVSFWTTKRLDESIPYERFENETYDKAIYLEDASEYDIFLAFLKERLKPEQVKTGEGK